jgi:hypothetical protein
VGLKFYPKKLHLPQADSAPDDRIVKGSRANLRQLCDIAAGMQQLSIAAFAMPEFVRGTRRFAARGP